MERKLDLLFKTAIYALSAYIMLQESGVNFPIKAWAHNQAMKGYGWIASRCARLACAHYRAYLDEVSP